MVQVVFFGLNELWCESGALRSAESVNEIETKALTEHKGINFFENTCRIIHENERTGMNTEQ
jgi:hypothetical protein